MTARSRKYDGNSVIRNHAVAKEPRKAFRGGPIDQGCSNFPLLFCLQLTNVHEAIKK